jgi:hypothetical protein
MSTSTPDVSVAKSGLQRFWGNAMPMFGYPG